ncbi:MAG TPA: hypothetical protein PLI12_09125, partial [Acetobacteraceae bacterium]|nr:hypothetical protein [Acetobacteraceae bacterium]
MKKWIIVDAAVAVAFVAIVGTAAWGMMQGVRAQAALAPPSMTEYRLPKEIDQSIPQATLMQQSKAGDRLADVQLQADIANDDKATPAERADAHTRLHDLCFPGDHTQVEEYSCFVLATVDDSAPSPGQAEEIAALQKAIALNQPNAMVLLGLVLTQADHPAPSAAAQALQLYKRAAHLGYTYGAYRYAEALRAALPPDASNADRDRVIKWYHYAALPPDPVAKAQYQLGLLAAEDGYGDFPASPDAGFTDIEAAASHGSMEGAYMLGIFYQKGIGTPVDRLRAMAMYLIVASDSPKGSKIRQARQRPFGRRFDDHARRVARQGRIIGGGVGEIPSERTMIMKPRAMALQARELWAASPAETGADRALVY